MELALLLIFLATQAGDFITTKIVLDKGGSEANPIVRAAMDKFGIFGLALWKFWASGLMSYVYYTNITGDFFMHLCIGLIIFYAGILYNNIKVIRVLNGRV